MDSVRQAISTVGSYATAGAAAIKSKVSEASAWLSTKVSGSFPEAGISFEASFGGAVSSLKNFMSAALQSQSSDTAQETRIPFSFKNQMGKISAFFSFKKDASDGDVYRMSSFSTSRESILAQALAKTGQYDRNKVSETFADRSKWYTMEKDKELLNFFFYHSCFLPKNQRR